MALADLVDIRVEFGLGAAGDAGTVWDTALWDTGMWASSEIQWTDMTSLCHSYTTRMGKRTNLGASLKRSRTGTAVFIMDNTGGFFIPGADTPGFLNLRPGRYVRIMARPKDDYSPPVSTPIPDGYTWTGSTGRTWASHGTAMTIYDPGSGSPVQEWVPIWFGRIDTIDQTSRQGDEMSKVSCTDAFAELAVNTKPAVADVGSGDTASERITRILDNADWPDDRRDITAGGYEMQSTTLAQDALQLCQITTDSTDGDFWQKPDGVLAWRPSGWRPETPDWYLGGIGGLPVQSATPEWSSFRIINEAHYSRRGGTEQVVTDLGSFYTYGRRTHTRLDLENLNDADVLTLATGVVTALRNDRMVLTEITVLVQDSDTVDFALNIEYGQLLQVTVDSMHGYSNTYRCYVVSIADDTTPDGWVLTLGLESADIPNINGPYDYEAFSNAYHLGGQ